MRGSLERNTEMKKEKIMGMAVRFAGFEPRSPFVPSQALSGITKAP